VSIQVSFIIPHKGRFEMLIATLESIARQDFEPYKMEVVVVSQTPEIQQAQLSTHDSLNLSVQVAEQSLTISALRNLGAKTAKGEYLAFLDADVALSDNWIHAMLSLLNQQGTQRAIASAVQISGDNPPPLELIRTHLSNAETDCNVAFLPGRNLFMRRTTFDQVGGFPEHLITCEDYYFTDQAAKLGELYYSSTASYVHLGEDKIFKDMFKKEIWRGQSNLQSLQGRTVPLREIPSLVVPIAIFGALLASLLCLLLAWHQLAAVMFGLALLPVVVYSLRLYGLARNEVSLWQIIKFYALYFPARAIGTIAGLFQSIQTRSH